MVDSSLEGSRQLKELDVCPEKSGTEWHFCQNC